MIKSKLEKIDSIEEEIAQLRNRQKLLKQQHNKQERKERTHRLCRRGGLVEKLLPDLARITDEQFDIFVDKVLLTPHTERILKGLVPPPPESVSEPDVDVSSAQDGEAVAPKPAGAAHNGGTGGNANKNNGSRQAN